MRKDLLKTLQSTPAMTQFQEEASASSPGKPDAPVLPKGYYSRPVLGGEYDALKNVLGAAEAEAGKRAQEYDWAKKDALAAQESTRLWQKHVEFWEKKYRENPSEATAARYNSVAANMQKMQTDYGRAQEKAKTAYDQVVAAGTAYRSAAEKYLQYHNDQQQQYQDWRSTIREGSTIQQELAQMDGEIGALEQEIRNLETLTRFRNDALGQSMRESLARAQAQMQQLQAARALLQEEYDWSRYFGYSDLTKADDFQAGSQYISTANGLNPVFNLQTGRYDETGFRDLTYDYINKNADAVERGLVNDSVLGGVDKTYLQKMTDQEVAIFNYLYATQGPNAAYDYTKYLTEDLNRRHRMEQESIWAGWAQDNPVATSVYSVLTSPLRGLSYAGQAAQLLTEGKIDPNATYNKFSYIPNAIRGKVAEKIEEGKWGSVGSFGYQTAMSMADFLFSTVASGGNAGLAMTIMGSGAAADTTLSARERGVDSGKAFTLGAVAGLAEAVTEKFSLEALLDPKLLKDSVLKYIGKNMLAEGGEEAASSLINLFADIMISGDKSEWQKSIDTYMAQGMSEKEAFLQAFKDQALNISLDALGGAISGGVLGGGNAAIQGFYNRQMTKPYDLKNATENDAQALIDSGLESAEDTQSYQLAQQLQKKLDAGKVPSAEELSRLAMANQIAIQAETAAEEAEPEGVQLPKLEDETKAGTEPAQDLNGGTHYEGNHGTAAAEAAAGTGVLPGSSQRYDGAGAREQAGRLGGRAGQAAAGNWPGADTARKAVRRTNLGTNLPKVSSASLGLSDGTDAARIQVFPREYWDEAMAAKAEQVYQETGKEITYVLGGLEFRNSQGGVSTAKGVILEDRIIVQANHSKYTPEQIADHEAFHGMRDLYSQSLSNQLVERITEEYSEEEFMQVLEKYIPALRGVFDLNASEDSAEYGRQMNGIIEELLADAHAGMNMWGAGATKFTGTVNRFLDEKGISRNTSQENGVRKTNGPPEERYSYAGEKAKTADLEALERAKQMQAAGVAEETIRQETGWFRGMDGKWRWEIDDSGMQYTQRGDLGFRERNPGYVRYRELLDKSNRYVLELSDEALTDSEQAELKRLSGIWKGTFQKPGRVTEDALPQNRLGDYLKHDALFEAYPMLRDTELRFANLPDGTRGQLDLSKNRITLNENLRRAPEDTLIHEIQHVIQDTEDFAMGSSTEFWDGQEIAKPEYAKAVQEARERVEQAETAFRREWKDDINLNLAKQYVELDNSFWSENMTPELAQENENQMEQIAQAAEEGGWGDLFDEYYYAVGELQMAIERAKWNRRTSFDLYRNTAGEIEARDAAGRRKLTPEQRRATEPAKGDERTVFAEGSSNSASQETDSEDRIQGADVEVLRTIGRKNINAFTSEDIRKSKKWANKFYREFGTKSPFFRAWFGDWRAGDTSTVKILRLTEKQSAPAGKVVNADTGKTISWGRDYFREAGRHQRAGGIVSQIVGNATEIAENAVYFDTVVSMPTSKSKMPHTAFMHHMYTLVEYGGDVYLEKLYIEEALNSKETEIFSRAYTLKDIKKVAQVPNSVLSNEGGLTGGTSATEISVADLFSIVKEFDPEFTPKPSSKAVNEDGTPKIYYHGTNTDWTAYDMSKNVNQMWGEGIYLAETEERARLYGDNVMPFYVRAIYNNRDARREGTQRDHTRMKNGDLLVYSPDQIKSATSNIGTFDGANPDIRYSVDEGEAQNPRKQTRPVAESKPLIAKRKLRTRLLGYFSIPDGMKAELGSMIDNYADRLIKNGSLTEEDRKHFFDRMYESGVMTVPADDYYAEARSYLKEGRIYVPDSVVADFGDDWQDIRKRAFAAGIYLTRSRTSGNHSISGIDTWNQDLASEVPGLFNSEETDQRTILERIVQVAEEGRDENMSLAEYTARLAESEQQSEEEFLDNMERELDWALRTFAENANLELQLRDRTGVKIAQEREKSTERMTKQRVKEAQRRANERQARKESAQRAKDRRELQELQQRTLKQLQWLSRNRNRAPEELKATWDEVLGDIDLFAVSAANEMRWSEKHQATWKDLAQMYKDAQKNDPNFLPSKDLERIVTRLDAAKIADMDLGALQDLYKAAIGLRTEFYNRNNVINDETQRLFAEVYTDAKREIESAPGGFTGGVADKFLNMDQLTPMNVLQRMGGWDPNGAFYSMARQLEKGERDMRAYSVKAQKMLADFLTEHEDWMKKADGQGKDAIWYEVEVPQLLELGMGDKPIFGPTVKVYMTPSQKVHMYLESKNLDNLRHMTGGRTFANKELYSQGKRQEALAQGRTIRLAPETVKKLVSDLTPEEMELAKLLDQYYNSFATQEINRISNILYGYDKAMGKNYAPIYTNRNYTKSEFGVFDVTAEGVGNLKGRQYAVNPSYNISAFDAFERHVDQTARFVGMAIPARNWTTLMNWREKNNSTGDVITHKWGEESKKYITDLITTLQAGDNAKSDTISAGISKLQSNYITAIFGANPSIVLKQLGSIPMAGAYLDARNVPTPAQLKNIDRGLISKYTQELEWRTMGYTTPETKQLKDNPNWTQSNKFIRFTLGGGAITAMDGWAASALWPWAENKVRREYPDLEIGTKAQIDAGESPFYKKVAEEFENAITRSQSVSDEIHQGSLRKSKNPVTKAFTMFRSDSAQTYNTLRQKIGEAQYYARTGATEKMQATAKKAVGTAFMAMLLNAMWGESINFLMALWKNKGKYYRDDEDELTAASVLGEMGSGVLGSFAGIVTGGEEALEVIGNILTGKKIYDIETPGMEQLNDLIETLSTAAGDMRGLVSGGWDILKNGGDLGEYFGKNSGVIRGAIKDLAEAAAMYIPGFPASNLEAYLLGAVKWISPELGTAYDDLFSSMGKSNLKGLEGGALETRIGGILSDRKISDSDETSKALAALYAAGYKTAMPSDTPASVTVKKESHALGAYQQQVYENIWNGIVSDALDDLVASEQFASADPETQAKMLDRLYDYAAEHAKAELFDEYELGTGAESIDLLRDAGLDLEECITWASQVSGMKQAEKFEALRQWDMTDKEKLAVMGTLIGTDMETESGKPSQYAKMLDALNQGMDMNQYLDMRLKGTDVEDYLDLIEEGMDADLAYDFSNYMEDLEQAADGADLDDLTRWRASVDFSNDVDDQLAALSMVMTDSQMIGVEVANNFGIVPDLYVKFYEVRGQYDADGNGSFKQAEVKAVIDGQFGNLSKAQKAALWQLMNSSTRSAKNNPYSQEIGQKVLDAKEAAKNATVEEEEPEGLKLGSW